jgi:hypothetical protein
MSRPAQTPHVRSTHQSRRAKPCAARRCSKRRVRRSARAPAIRLRSTIGARRMRNGEPIRFIPLILQATSSRLIIETFRDFE